MDRSKEPFVYPSEPSKLVEKAAVACAKVTHNKEHSAKKSLIMVVEYIVEKLNRDIK